MRFAFVGDIYLGSREEPWHSAEVPDLHRELGVDVVVGNFESVVDGSEVGCPHPGKIHLSTPRSSVVKLKDMGVDVVSVANNHIGDYGPKAAEHTIKILGEVFGGENVFGWSGRPTAELAPGLNVAAAVFTETNPVVPDGRSRVSTAEDLEGFLASGQGARGQLIVYAHWGEEYLSLTAPGLRHRAREMRAAGVTHVVGVHSHVVGAVEVMDEFSASYSLGNFLFHVTRKGNTKMIRRTTRGAAAVFSWDGEAVTLDGFRRSTFDADLNLCLGKAVCRYPGTLVSQMHLRAPESVASRAYEVSQKSRWLSLGLARLIEGVERPSLKKVRTLTAHLRRRYRTAAETAGTGDRVKRGLGERLKLLLPGQYVPSVDRWLTPAVVEHDFESLPGSLRFALKASLAGVVSGVVLLGHIWETQLAFYALMSVSLIVYLMARGEELATSLIDYLTSRRVVWRWAFVVWAIVSLLWTTRGRLSVDRAMTLVEIQVVGLIFFDAAKNLGLSRWILNTVLVCAVIAAAQAVATADLTAAGRMAGLYATPNTLAIVCVTGLAVFVAVAAKPRGAVASIGMHVAALILLVGIVGSASLKGMMGMLLVCGLGVVLSASRVRSITFVSVAVGIGAALVTFVQPIRMVWNHAIYRLEATLAATGTSGDVSQSAVERARFIRKGLVLIADAPLFGRGLETFRWLSNEGSYAHNNIVELGVALGLVGVLLFYAFHVSILRGAAHTRRTDDFVWRFIVIAVPTLLLLDIAVVSYTSKLSTLLLIMGAGWLGRTSVAGGRSASNRSAR